MTFFLIAVIYFLGAFITGFICEKADIGERNDGFLWPVLIPMCSVLIGGVFLIYAIEWTMDKSFALFSTLLQCGKGSNSQ